MENIRARVRRALSMHDKNADPDEHEDVDEESTGHLHKDIEEAEEKGYPQGRPNSFLNRLISHGNDKTEKQIAQENAAKAAAKENEKPQASTTS